MPYLIYLLLLLYSTASLAQDRYNDIWYLMRGHNFKFDRSTNNTIINSVMPPYPVALIRQFQRNSIRTPVSDPQTGALLFFYHNSTRIPGDGSYTPNSYLFFDQNGEPMPNSRLHYEHLTGEEGYPHIIPHPKHAHLYYICYVRDAALRYSMVDMTLNNGLGDVSILDYTLLPIGQVIGTKVAITKSCNGVNIIAKLNTGQRFATIQIDADGHIHTQPLYSESGTNLPIRAYQQIERTGISFMKASPNGKLLAIATNNGVELHDIDPCNGMLSNARIIDTTQSFGVCFSPNNQYLYTTRKEYQTGYTQSSEIMQWDVSDPTNLNQIRQSGYQVMVNSVYYWPYSNLYLSSYMGSIAVGPDGKLYIASDTKYLYDEPAQPVPPYTTVVPWAQTLHIIHAPNNSGAACSPERDAHYLDGDYQNGAGAYLPNPVITIDTVKPNVKTQTHIVQQCFGAKTTLMIDSTATCIQWYNGHDRISLNTSDTGMLWVNYSIGCTPHSDTFIVTTTTMPTIQDYILACTGQGGITLPKLDNRASYSFELKQQGRTIRSGNSDTTVVLRQLQAGSYQLHYRTGGCDTTIAIQIEDLPKPWITTIPTDSIAIHYGDSVRITASGAYLYTWSPTQHLDTTQGETVIARPHHPTRYEVVGFNEYGCIDTAYIKVNIDYGMEIFLPNAFTPNGDGLNDVFGLHGQTFQYLKGFYIYNRYGQEVYFSQDVNASWDGTQNGQPCDVGVYYYMLEVVLPNGKAKAHKGEVHLIR